MMRSAHRPVTALVATAALVLGGCERERRNFHEAPPGATVPGAVRMSELQPGVPLQEVNYTVYEDNAWAISQGQRLFIWFNCNGCHAPGGGGSIGPPLIDDEWIYGSAPENIFHTIQEGRPDGMPSFKGRISAADTWKLVAYVRYLSELTPPDTWPGRADIMEEANPEPEEGSAREGSPMARRRR
jgi:cytochrome c oxidase cbb3-type subunit 3